MGKSNGEAAAAAKNTKMDSWYTSRNVSTLDPVASHRVRKKIKCMVPWHCTTTGLLPDPGRVPPKKLV